MPTDTDNGETAMPAPETTEDVCSACLMPDRPFPLMNLPDWQWASCKSVHCPQRKNTMPAPETTCDDWLSDINPMWITPSKVLIKRRKMFESGFVPYEAILDTIFSTVELESAGWKKDWMGNWRHPTAR